MARIVVVDDSPTSRLLLVTVLGYAGHEVFEASDGVEGLEMVHAQRPDLLITDIVMPVMGGAELIDRLRSDPAFAHLPAVLYTASDRWDDVSALAQSRRASAIIRKPAEPQFIFDAVAAALGRGHAG